MSLTDRELDAQLRRRAEPPGGATLLADGIRDEVSSMRQSPARPWHRWSDASAVPGSRPAIGWLSAMVAVIVVATMIVAYGLQGAPRIGPGPGMTGWLLTGAQLQAVVDRAASDGSNVGKVIVARVNVAESGPAIACPAPSLHPPACPTTFAVEGSNPTIAVIGVPNAPTCPSPTPCRIAPPTGPVALRILSNHAVEYIAQVALDGGDASVEPESITQFEAGVAAGSIEKDPTRFSVVQGWLVSDAAIYFCPAQLSPIADLHTDYSCGGATWLSPEAFQPTTVTHAPGSTNTSTTAPPGGVRVQNLAYDDFAPSPKRIPPDGLVDPRQGIYLIGALSSVSGACWMCDRTPLAHVVARIDAVEIRGPTLSAESLPPATTTSTTPDADASWFVTTDDLAALISRASISDEGTGRVVVADVTFEAFGSCPTQFDPNICYPVIVGTDPPIRLMDPPSSECPPLWRCLLPHQPYVPNDGPFALRIRSDGAVDWVGWVQPPADAATSWTFDAFRDRLAALQPTEIDAFRLYPVTGWVSSEGLLVLCGPRPSDASSRFGCTDRPVLLTGSPWVPSPDVPPDGSVRLQNGAEDVVEISIDGPAPASRLGTFLVLPAIPTPDPCDFCDRGLAADVIARLGDDAASQPPSPPPGASSSSAASSSAPSASLSTEAGYALAYAQKFEQERSTGEFHGAWVLLGPATRAVFGSEERFVQQEADYNATGATTYVVSDPVRNPDLLSESEMGSAVWSEVEVATAWFVGINHPNVVGASAGFEGLVIGQGTDGAWHVWIVH